MKAPEQGMPVHLHGKRRLRNRRQLPETYQRVRGGGTRSCAISGGYEAIPVDHEWGVSAFPKGMADLRRYRGYLLVARSGSWLFHLIFQT